MLLTLHGWIGKTKHLELMCFCYLFQRRIMIPYTEQHESERISWVSSCKGQDTPYKPVGSNVMVLTMKANGEG